MGIDQYSGVLFAEKVSQICTSLADMLIEKNASYGNAALDPVRIFSKADPVEQIKVRIDDKLSRLQADKEYPGEDTLKDLIGYLILLKIALDVQGSTLPNTKTSS